MEDPQFQKQINLFKTKSDLHWVKDSKGVLIFNPSREASHYLQGTEAALWEWCSLFSWLEIVELLSTFLRIPREVAERQAAQILSTWYAAGLLDMEKG
jgi:hypothetical protein